MIRSDKKSKKLLLWNCIEFMNELRWEKQIELCFIDFLDNTKNCLFFRFAHLLVNWNCDWMKTRFSPSDENKIRRTHWIFLCLTLINRFSFLTINQFSIFRLSLVLLLFEMFDYDGSDLRLLDVVRSIDRFVWWSMVTENSSFVDLVEIS